MKSKQTRRASQHRGGGLLAKSSVVGPILPTVSQMPDAVARLNTRYLLNKPLISEIGLSTIPDNDVTAYNRQYTAKQGGKSKIRKRRSRKMKKAIKLTKVSKVPHHNKKKQNTIKKLNGGSLNYGPARQLYNEVLGDIEELGSTIGGLNVTKRIKNAPKFIRKEMRVLPKWLP